MVECEFNFSGKMAQMTTVLIDTWWNVNLMKSAVIMLYHGFNRYMVECECFPYRNIGIQSKVLIDTWWNVNLFPCLSG